MGLLALRLPSPLRVRLFSPRGRRWLRGMRRRFRKGGGGEEVLVGWAYQSPPFQVGSPIVPGDCVGASSGCPYPQEWTG